MIDFLKSFKPFIKTEEIHIDNTVFKMHYKISAVMLVVFSLLLTSKQYFGEPIQCDIQNEKSKEVIETYCWIYGTYTVKSTLSDEILPGLGLNRNWQAPSWIKNFESKTQTEFTWQKYYQWVCIMFSLQAVFFYGPRYLWKSWEGGRLRLLIKDLSGPLVPPLWDDAKKESVVEYFLSGRSSHQIYAIRYVVCEFLNLLNVIMQIVLMDWFLSGKFTMYGLNFMTYTKINPMIETFPKLTKCLYYRYGASGSLENRDALCILPLNILNEKLFLILWFWFFFLCFVSLCSMVYRVFVLCSPKVRIYLLTAQARQVGMKQISWIANKLSYGDFFILYLLGKNVNPIIYSDILMEMQERFKGKQAKNLSDFI